MLREREIGSNDFRCNFPSKFSLLSNNRGRCDLRIGIGGEFWQKLDIL